MAPIEIALSEEDEKEELDNENNIKYSNDWKL